LITASSLPNVFGEPPWRWISLGLTVVAAGLTAIAIADLHESTGTWSRIFGATSLLIDDDIKRVLYRAGAAATARGRTATTVADIAAALREERPVAAVQAADHSTEDRASKRRGGSPEEPATPTKAVALDASAAQVVKRAIAIATWHGRARAVLSDLVQAVTEIKS
jgi:hypothetical protein